MFLSPGLLACSKSSGGVRPRAASSTNSYRTYYRGEAKPLGCEETTGQGAKNWTWPWSSARPVIGRSAPLAKGQIMAVGFTAHVGRTGLSPAVSANDLGLFLSQFSGNHPIFFCTRLNKSFERGNHCCGNREASHLEGGREQERVHELMETVLGRTANVL